MTTTGSCACGEVQFKFTGDVALSALCHCTDCQKWTGSAFSANAVVPRTVFEVTKGTPKDWDVIGDSGKINKRFFCGNCGSGLYTHIEVMPDVTIVKAGALENGAASLGNAVAVEFYTKDRVGYLKGCEGAKQEHAFGGQ